MDSRSVMQLSISHAWLNWYSKWLDFFVHGNDMLLCLLTESLDYFQQCDSSADEGGLANEEAMPGSAMDTSSPSTATNQVRRTSSNPENSPAEPSASSRAPAQRQAFRSRDLHADHPVSSGVNIGIATAEPPTSIPSSAITLDAGENFNIPCCQLLALCALFHFCDCNVFLVNYFFMKSIVYILWVLVHLHDIVSFLNMLPRT